MKTLLLSLLLSNLLNAQVSQLEWAKIQPNSEIGGTVSSVSSAKDASGNVYIIGNFNNTANFDTSLNGGKLTSIGNSDLYISKYNSVGDFIWAKNIGGPGTIIPRQIEITGSSLYLTGSFTGTIDFDASSSNLTNLTSNGESDIFIMKYNLNGGYISAINVGGSSFDEGFDINFFNDELFVVGTYIGNVDFDPSTTTSVPVSSGFTDIFVAKYTSNLGFISTFQILGTTTSNTATSLAFDAAGNIHLLGLFRGTIDFDPSINTTSLTSTSTDVSNAFIAKYSNSGNLIWVKDIGGRNTEFAINKLALDSSNAILVDGTFNRSSDFNPSSATLTLAPSIDSNDAFFAKYDLDGNYMWAKKLGSTGSDSCFSIATDISNNVYISGVFSGGSVSFGIVSLNSTNGAGYVAKYTASGTNLFAFNAGTKASNIVLDETTNSLYASGSFVNTMDFDPASTSTSLLYAEQDNVYFAKYSLNGGYSFSKNIGNISSNNAPNLISVDGSENVYRAGNLGSILDLDPSSNIANVISTGWTDFYLAKYTSNGDYIWGETIEGLKFNDVKIMNTDYEGDTFVIGTFLGSVDFDPSPATLILSATASTLTLVDTFIAKYDTNGNLVWAKKFDGRVNPIDSIQFDNNGNFYFMGRMSGTVDFDLSASTYYITANLTSTADMFFAKYSPQGDVIWVKPLRSIDGGLSVPFNIYIKSNSIYLTGIYNGTIDFNPSISQNFYILSNGLSGFLAKYDLNGNFNLAFSLEEATNVNNVWGYSALEDDAGNFYFFTQYNGTIDFDPSTTSSTSITATNYSIGISKYTSTGSFLWAKSILGTNTNGWASFIGFKTFMYSNNSFIVCGAFGGSYDFDPSSSNSLLTTSLDSANLYQDNIFIARYDLDGELVSVNKLNGNYYGTLTSAVFQNNQDLLITGSYTGSASFDLSNNNQIVSSSRNYNDRYFAKYHFNSLSSNEFNENKFSIYPNPTSSILNIRLPSSDQYIYKIIDLTGKILSEGTIDNDNLIDVSHLSSGVYFISMFNKVNNKETLKFIKD